MRNKSFSTAVLGLFLYSSFSVYSMEDPDPSKEVEVKNIEKKSSSSELINFVGEIFKDNGVVSDCVKRSSGLEKFNLNTLRAIALEKVIKKGDELEEVVDEILGNSFHSVLCVNEVGKNLLWEACYQNDRSLKIAQRLLVKGIDPNLKDERGNTVLNYCSARGTFRFMEFLLDNRADPDISNKDGYTPLITVCSKAGADEFEDAEGRVQLLIQHNANVNLQVRKEKDGSSQTALSIARAKNAQRIIELLEGN